MKKLLLTVSIFIFLCSPAWGAVVTWQGDDVTNPTFWNDADNWGTGTVPVAGDDVIIANANNCFVNANTAALKSLDMTGYTGILSGTFNITIRGLTASTNVCKIVGIGTWTGTLIFSPASTTAVIQLTSNANALTTMTVTSGAAVSLVVLQDNLTFTAVKTCSITLTERGLDLNGKTITGNSAVNKLLITSNTLGTSTNRTITGATATSFNNVDFRNISFTTAGALDLTNSQVNWIGDCGGNSATGGALTFTTADDWYWNGSGTRNFSDYTYWYTATNGGGTQMASTRCPLPQDNCFFDGASIDGATTVDQDMPRVCKTLDFTGCAAMNFDMNNISQTFYGSLIFVSNVTINLGGSSQVIYFQGDRSGTFTFTPNWSGTESTKFYIQTIGGAIQLGSNLILGVGSGGSMLLLDYGTFDANDYDVTIGRFNSDNSNARKLLMGNGTWTLLNNVAGIEWDMGVITNLDVASSAEGSIIITSTSNVNDTFEGGGWTYNNLTISTSTGIMTFTGSNTFNTFTINAPKTVKFTSGTTQYVNSFVATGSAGNDINLQAVTTNSIATISDLDGGTNVNDYLIVADIVANEANTFYYGANGSADAESTNWLSVPVSGRRIFLIQ